MKNATLQRRSTDTTCACQAPAAVRWGNETYCGACALRELGSQAMNPMSAKYPINRAAVLRGFAG